MSQELVLDLDTASGDDATSWQRCLTLHFAYASSDAPWIPSRLNVEHGPLSLSYNFLCHGYDLTQFADALRRMQGGNAESAAFADQCEEVAVSLSWADRGQGRIHVDTTVSVLLPTAFGYDRRPTICRFGGFGIEQTYLRGIASNIERFLTFWDLPRDHPMMGA